VVPREVAHWAYFADEDKRNAFIARAKILGYALSSEINPDGENPKWGAIVTRNDPVDFRSIADATLSLFDLAQELGGEYDGWETPVVEQPDADESHP
jgi:hypothetical protein